VFTDMEQWAEIRRRVLTGEISKREACREYDLHWQTLKKVLGPWSLIAMGVGGFMPLAGVGFYVCCAIMRCDVEAASRAMIPYLVVVLVGLLFVAFVPWFALLLPNYFGFRG